MQEASSHAVAPPTLLDEIRRGGRLAVLFRQAAGEQTAATRQLLRDRRSATLLENLHSDAQARQQAGAASNSLTVLHQCAPGCTACCRQSVVDVTPLEALALGAYLRECNSSDELHALRQRLARAAEQRAAWRAGKRNEPALPCALLGEDGLCQAYQARPLICAGVYSFSRAACEVAQPGPSETNVPLDRPAKAWSMGVSGGLQKALVAAGLDGNLYELNSAVLCVLQTERAFERWLKREDIFAACQCTDAHSWPRKTQARFRIDAAHAAAKGRTTSTAAAARQ